jgi:hypothetical protein
LSLRLLVDEDTQAKTDMTYTAIVRALANLEASGWDPAGQFIVLNAWNW